MHFWRSRGSILHKLSKILLSGKSTYGSRETELYSGARRMFRESRMCLQTIHYIYATKGEITGMIAPAMVIVSIQVATEFAPEGWDYLVWRASQFFQNMLGSVIRLKDLVSPGAQNPERLTFILRLCNGVFSSRFIFRWAFPVNCFRQANH